jgi:hypothetical protein
MLETTYEVTKIVKPAKLQILVSEFEGIKMLEDKSFSEFYIRITDLRNSMINLGKKVSDVKLIKNILIALPKRFSIKVTTIEESKDLDEMKLEELVGSLLTYELTLPPVKKNKSIALKAAKGKNKISSNEETDDEDGLTMLARKFGKLMKSKRFKRFNNNFQGNPKCVEQVDTNEKDSLGPRCLECSSFGHIRADCGNLKQAKGKALNVTLSDDSENEETPSKDPNFLAFTTSHNDSDESLSYCSKSSDDENLVEVYKKLYIKFMKLREVNQQNVQRLDLYEKKRSRQIARI